MKKKILFIISTLRCGGAEHALISLLNVMDYDKYEIDLLILCKEGMFYKDKIPSKVNIVEPDISVSAVLEPTVNNMWKCVKYGKWKYIKMHLKRIKDERLKKEKITQNLWSEYWMKYRDYIKPLNKEYDVSIGYLEGLSNYFCIDKVSAKCKIGWMHTNYADSNQNKKVDALYFPKFDYMATMSEAATETLKNEFPEIKKNIYTIHNILDESEVQKLAEEDVEEIIDKKNKFTIVSVGNILPVKGYDMAVKACAELVQEGIELKWYVVGRKDQAEEIEELIRKYNLEDEFILLGVRKNPYKYMEAADIYVQCSRYEGFSTTIREAKLLCKPIVATNCQGIKEQIQDGVNGILTEIDARSIYEGVHRLINDEKLRMKCTEKLKEDLKNSNEIKMELTKLYRLLDGE